MLVSLLTVTASAQDDDFGMDFTTTEPAPVTATEPPPATGFSFPVSFSDRPLTLQKHAVRGNFNVAIAGSCQIGVAFVVGFTNQTCAALDFGGSFGVLDDLEVGINGQRFGAAPLFKGSTPNLGTGLLPIVVAPAGDFGDIPMYVRYSFLKKDNWELAVDGVLLLPSNTDFAFTAGVPIRFTGIDNLSIDLGANFTVVANGQAWVDLTIPVRVTFNITDEVFINGGSGLGFTRLGGPNDIEIPIAIGGGYTLLIKDKVMMDFVGEFGFRPLIEATGTTQVVDAGNSWYFTFGVAVWSESLF